MNKKIVSILLVIILTLSVTILAVGCSKQIFNIKISEIENGTVTVNNKTAVEGDVVIVTATPNKGCMLTAGSLKVNNKVIVDGKFTMPEADVTITAAFNTGLVPAEYTPNNLVEMLDAAESFKLIATGSFQGIVGVEYNIVINEDAYYYEGREGDSETSHYIWTDNSIIYEYQNYSFQPEYTKEIVNSVSRNFHDYLEPLRKNQNNIEFFTKNENGIYVIAENMIDKYMDVQSGYSEETVRGVSVEIGADYIIVSQKIDGNGFAKSTRISHFNNAKVKVPDFAINAELTTKRL